MQDTLSSKLDCGQVVQGLLGDVNSAKDLWGGAHKAASVTLTSVVKDQQAHMSRLAKDAGMVLNTLR